MEATTLALAQATGSAVVVDRDEIASRLTTVALQCNADVYNDRLLDAASIGSSAFYWKAVSDKRWPVWTHGLIDHLANGAAPMLDDFESRYGLTLTEWYHRTYGEYGGRLVREPGPYRDTDKVNPDLESSWREMMTTPIASAIEAAREATDRGRNGVPYVPNPYNLTWAGRRPVVQLESGDRFVVWRESLGRLLSPAALTELLASDDDLSDSGSAIGRATEAKLADIVESVAPQSERRIPESAMPRGPKKCDYLLVQDDFIVGLEFTTKRPTLAASAGLKRDLLVGMVAEKVNQIYVSMHRLDPNGEKRHLPVVVYGSPFISDELFNEEVYSKLLADGAALGDSELMSCYAPHFHDLVIAAGQQGQDISSLVAKWRDHPTLSGGSLDLWLYDQGLLGRALPHQIEPISLEAESVLVRA